MPIKDFSRYKVDPDILCHWSQNSIAVAVMRCLSLTLKTFTEDLNLVKENYLNGVATFHSHCINPLKEGIRGETFSTFSRSHQFSDGEMNGLRE